MSRLQAVSTSGSVISSARSYSMYDKMSLLTESSYAAAFAFSAVSRLILKKRSEYTILNNHSKLIMTFVHCLIEIIFISVHIRTIILIRLLIMQW